MNAEHYEHVLYPLQERALRVVFGVESGFYLSGGTAASRGYLRHRYSDDLDLFVNDDARFGLWVERVIARLSESSDWTVSVLGKDERFARVIITTPAAALKLEMINDVPAHIGEIIWHDLLGRLDSAENILANKITAALDRREPKDLADIWGFVCRHGASLTRALTDASSKAAGVFPADLACVLCSVTKYDHKAVRWIASPPYERYRAELVGLGESLIL